MTKGTPPECSVHGTHQFVIPVEYQNRWLDGDMANWPPKYMIVIKLRCACGEEQDR